MSHILDGLRYVVNYLANNYKVDDEVTRLLDEVELIVVPFVNPDGYVFTWSGDRLWRKSRNVNVGSTCMGEACVLFSSVGGVCRTPVFSILDVHSVACL